ncbi:MAG: FecR domain-containing protein [Gammaproteobacteria bacterium]
MNASEQVKDPRLTREAADWHARLRSQALSEVDEARFRAWLAGNPARRQEFDEISAMWDQLGALAQSPEVLGELHRAEPAIEAPAAPRRVSRRMVVGWALAASVVATAGIASWQWLSAPELYATGVGEQKIVPLGDGSVVTLNTSSRVNVRFSRSQRRVEVLSGQANFAVAKNAARPFIVSAGGGETLAVGTEFDVYQRGDDTLVTLIEGRVTVTSPLAGASAIALIAGEQVTYSAQRAPRRTMADLQRASAWRARKLDFADTPLREAISEANRYSKLKIELRGAELADAKISGVFEAGRNDSVAEGVRAYFGLHLERFGDDLIVLSQAAR